MRQCLATTFATVLGGCSLIYGTGDLPTPGEDAPIPPDFTKPELTKVTPAKIFEGQGDGEGGRPAVVVIEGRNIASDAQITVTAQNSSTDFTATKLGLASQDGRFIAIAIVAKVVAKDPVEDTLLDIRLEQMAPDGSSPTAMLAGQLSISGLPELDNTFDGNTAFLKPLYSRVDFGNKTIIGDKSHPAVIRSTSSIIVGNITAVGGSAGQGGSNPGAGGPGGCSGGDSQSDGDCAPSSGRGGGSGLGDGGGGGGGFAQDGAKGAGNNGVGAAGMAVGDPLVLTYAGNPQITANRPGGGGGGGGGGGSGGGGGGVVELSAETSITTGTITVDGGKGGDGGVATLLGGGGGGGAGGAIVLRAGTTLQTMKLSAVKGAGGGGGNGAGGEGSDGRIRWDVPNPAAMAPMATPAARRGPAFIDAPMSVSTLKPSLMLSGTSGDSFTVDVIDQDNVTHPGTAVFSFSGTTTTFEPDLQPGFNRVCIVLTGGVRVQPEAQKCVDIAALP